MNYRVMSYFRLNPLDITSIVHPLAQNAYMQKLHIRQMLEFDEILLVEQLPPQYGVLDPTGEVRKDVYFTLRCHIGNLIKRHGLKLGKKMRSMGGSYTRTVDSERPLSEFEKIPPLSASVVEYEKRHTVTKKTIKVSSPTIEEMLVNPELDGISPVNIDPISMLVDDAKTLLEDGVDFVKDPSLGGAAAMAITAIPGKIADDLIYLKGGSKGGWNKKLNGKLEPNSKYKVNEYLYFTDDVGRVQSVSGSLNLSKHDRNYYQQVKAGKVGGIKDGVYQDEGGHLIASIFNGPGEQINYAAMNGNLNKSAWKRMENTWAKALKGDPPKTVDVNIKAIYESDSKRPVAFDASYIIDGKKKSVFFLNSTGN